VHAAGVVQNLPGRAHTLCCGGLVAPGVAHTFTSEGLPGDLVLWFASAPAVTTVPLQLPLHLGLPAVTLGFSTTAANGRATKAVPMPDLPAGLSVVAFAVQALTFDAAGVPVATGPVSVLVR
jgi:hypothetical protein